jgi:large subunit ribosomal protein L4
LETKRDWKGPSRIPKISSMAGRRDHLRPHAKKEGKLILLDDFPLDGFKTRQVLQVLKRFQVEDALIVTDDRHPYLERSSRNIPGIEVLRYEGLTVYDILNHNHLILLRPTVEKIKGALAS